MTPTTSTHPSTDQLTSSQASTMTLPYPLYNFFLNNLYCQLLNHHHPSSSPSSFSYTPFHVTDDPIEFHFSNFFRQLLSSLVHSACCTPYTFQFTFTFSFSIGNSLYFQLDDLVSKIPFFLLSRFFRSTSPTYPKIGSIRSIQFGVPHFSSSSLSLCSSICSWLSTKILAQCLWKHLRKNV